MENMDLAVLQDKLTKSPPSHQELKKMAREISKNILEKIHNSSKSLEEAQKKSEEANAKKIKVFGIGTKDKVDATADAVVKLNEAMVKMNDIVQESMKYSCVSYAFAGHMRNVLRQMIVAGFKANDGRMIKLNNNAQEMAGLVLKETDEFVETQKEQEARLEENAKEINENKANIEINTTNITQLQNQLGQSILRIDELEGKLSELNDDIEENTEGIEVNIANIVQLQNQLKQNIHRIDKLEEKLSKKIVIVILFILSILGLIVGSISLFLNLL